ncbi:GNAT family N-acetyltransferase [Actinophytocola sp.]|uniref:GNAT family N-acetyltransferase n=1 Tax=Actinophytocola sp. TaxID=1872138 RepID=UPI003D6C66B8
MSALQSHMRRAAASGRTTERVGPFLATFSPDTANPYLNYAIPDDGARPTRSDVDALTAAYRSRDLVPRLEFLVATAPDAEPVLRAAGYVVERRIPVLLCPPGALVTPPAPEGVELVVPESDVDFKGMVGAQHEAFGDTSPVDVAGARAWLEKGGFSVYARDAATGEPVGGGVAEPVVDGTAEVAGIAVRSAHRSRGVGAAITVWLTAAVHDRGARTVFLTPAGVAEQRLYTRVGYQAADDMLHLRLS